MPVTIDSTTPTGHYKITLTDKGNDRGSIDVKTWPPGVDPTRDPPSSDKLNDLYAIKAAADGSKVQCKAHAPIGPDPVVTCTVSGGGQPTVEVDIRGTFAHIADGTTKYPVTQTDADKLKAFFVAAHFPLL